MVLPLGLLACTTAAHPDASRLRNMPVVVTYALAPAASIKEGVTAVTDSGKVLFSPSSQRSFNESINAYSGGLNGSLPRWVRVTWRTGADIDLDTTNGRWKGGTIAGDYTVNVLKRIPDDVLAFASARHGRAIVLRFRLKDDGVLFSWDVQEAGKFGGWVYLMHGGDF